MFDWSIMPAKASSRMPAKRMGELCLTISAKYALPAFAMRKAHTMKMTRMIIAAGRTSCGNDTIRNAARRRDGMVNMSPSAVIIGDDMLSGFHPLLNDANAMMKVIARSMAPDIIPPMKDITTSDMSVMLSMPNARRMILAMNARRTEKMTESIIDEYMLLLIMWLSFEKPFTVPRCSADPSLEPSDENMLPRMPIAAGTSTRRPGSATSISS